jgi:hypothetical protein
MVSVSPPSTVRATNMVLEDRLIYMVATVAFVMVGLIFVLSVLLAYDYSKKHAICKGAVLLAIQVETTSDM